MIRLLPAIATLLLLTPIAAGADGYVWVGRDIHPGAVKLEGDRVTVGEKKWKLDAVAMVVPHGRSAASIRTPAVRMRDGQRWPAGVDRIERRMLIVEGPLVGRREIPLTRVAGFDLTLALSPAQTRPPVVVQAEGEPIPGELLWLDEQRIGIDSPLGVLKLPRSRATRVELAAPRPATDTDVLRLLDGTVLHGPVSLKDGRVAIDHATFGELDFALDAVAAIVRRDADRRWLDDASHWRLTARDVFGQPRSAAPGIDADGSVAVEAPATVELTLPADFDADRLVLMVEPLTDAAGDATASFSAGGQSLGSQRVRPTDGPSIIDLKLPAGAETLSIDVAPGDRLRFPAGVVLRDAQLIGGGG